MYPINTYPTLEEVEKADHRQICVWYRFLKSPSNEQENSILRKICERLKTFGGFTSELSKSIGW